MKFQLLGFMNRIGLTILLGSMSLTSFSQDTLSLDFSEKWKTDSRGLNMFRHNSVTYDSSQNTYLINQVNLIGLKKRNVISFLGPPDFQGKINNSLPIIGGIFITLNFPYITRTINYSLRTCSSKNEFQTSSFLSIEIRKNKVHEISLRDPCAEKGNSN